MRTYGKTSSVGPDAAAPNQMPFRKRVALAQYTSAQTPTRPDRFNYFLLQRNLIL
jgi:hypothetical protein